jgi:bifunctional DNA-binding transcriptional regulator/antitoxin component of YhaV-PrlF toxin-antitoxin module
MALELTVTAKGQVTLRRGVLDHLGVKAGEQVKVSLLPDGRVELTRAPEGINISTLCGVLRRPKQRMISLQEMQDAIEADGGK